MSKTFRCKKHTSLCKPFSKFFREAINYDFTTKTLIQNLSLSSFVVKNHQSNLVDYENNRE